MNELKKEQILKKAKHRAARLKKLRKDPRYQEVIGRLVYEKLLDAPKVPARNYKLHLKDMLWVGENIEPRVLELLPAILLKAPRIVYSEPLPEDLRRVKNDLVRGNIKGEFRGIVVKSCDQWITQIGRKDKRPSVRKIFFLSFKDTERLAQLSQQESVSEAEIVRRALRQYKK